MSYPGDREKFIHRSGGTSHVHAFPAHLQFNVATSRCDDPVTADAADLGQLASSTGQETRDLTAPISRS